MENIFREKSKRYNHLVFDHYVKFADGNCFVGSARDRETKRIHVFLYFHDERKIYARNGLSGTWEEIKDTADYDKISRLLNSAIFGNRMVDFPE